MSAPSSRRGRTAASVAPTPLALARAPRCGRCRGGHRPQPPVGAGSPMTSALAVFSRVVAAGALFSLTPCQRPETRSRPVVEATTTFSRSTSDLSIRAGDGVGTCQDYRPAYDPVAACITAARFSRGWRQPAVASKLAVMQAGEGLSPARAFGSSLCIRPASTHHAGRKARPSPRLSTGLPNGHISATQPSDEHVAVREHDRAHGRQLVRQQPQLGTRA